MRWFARLRTRLIGTLSLAVAFACEVKDTDR